MFAVRFLSGSNWIVPFAMSKGSAGTQHGGEASTEDGEGGVEGSFLGVEECLARGGKGMEVS